VAKAWRRAWGGAGGPPELAAQALHQGLDRARAERPAAFCAKERRLWVKGEGQRGDIGVHGLAHGGQHGRQSADALASFRRNARV
jgi:hypothetical protein